MQSITRVTNSARSCLGYDASPNKACKSPAYRLAGTPRRCAAGRPFTVALAAKSMYLRTDEETEAADALCMAAQLAKDLEHKPNLWRWLIIALHNAVQGFMVLSLRHGNGLAALSEQSFTEWMEAHEKGGPYPAKEKLDSYLNLYKKVKSKDYGQIGGNRRFVPKGTQGKSIKRLDTLRNEFIHFTPKGWSLELDGLPGICLDCIGLVRFLGWETSNIFWHEPQAKERSYSCIATLVGQLESLDKAYQCASS